MPGKASIAVFMLLAIGVAGCQQPHRVAYADRDTRWHGPAVADRPVSLATDAPRLRRLAADRLPEGEPWYAWRNDERPAVFAGYQSPTLDAVHVRTFDRISSFNGRVREHFHETHRRTRFRETVR